MKTDNPKATGLPDWPKYTMANGEPMILDDKCEVKNDPDREARKTLTLKSWAAARSVSGGSSTATAPSRDTAFDQREKDALAERLVMLIRG